MFSHARFTELMQRNGVSNYKLAQFLHCSQSSVKNWLSSTEPTAEYVSKIAEYFGVSVNYLLGIEDQYGLTDFDWRTMGSTYQTRRLMADVTLDGAVDDELLTSDQLKAFEEGGTPLNLTQLNVACGRIGATAPDVFSVWADRLWKEEMPPIIGERSITEADQKAAFWGGDQELSEEDKEALWADVKDYVAFKTAQRKNMKRRNNDA